MAPKYEDTQDFLKKLKEEDITPHTLLLLKIYEELMKLNQKKEIKYPITTKDPFYTPTTVDSTNK